MADLILTHPCPLCPPPGRMLTVTYEPLTRDAQDTGASLISVTGCLHAEAAMAEHNGDKLSPCSLCEGAGCLWRWGMCAPCRLCQGTGKLYIPVLPVAFWRELHHELQMYMLDRYTDQLESSGKYRRLQEDS